MNSSPKARAAEGPSFTRVGKLGARVLGITLLTLCLGFFVSSAHTIWSEQELFSEQLDQRGQSLCNVASLSCVELLLGKDYPSLGSFAQYLASSHPDVVFCKIERADGQVVAEAGKKPPDPARSPDRCREFGATIAINPSIPAEDKNIQGRISLGISTDALITRRHERVRAMLV